MSVYLGYDVLDQVGHNMREPIEQEFTRLGQLVRSPEGRSFWDDFPGVATPLRSFEWPLTKTRADVTALRGFIDARRGRLVPFWAPTYAAELVMSADSLAAASSITVYSVGYRQYLFPVTARKYLALVSPDGSFLRRKVTLVTDNLDGTESLSLDAGLGVDQLAATTLVSFLTLCRLEEDRVPIRWYAAGAAEASFRFREVPNEVPA